jgi:uncharacterized protein (TIGR03437 family)
VDSVTIRISGNPSVVSGIPVLPVQPGIFETVDTQTRRFVVAQHLDGRYVTPADPARLGEQIRAFFTGGGKQLATLPTTGAAGAAANYTGTVVVGVNGSGTRVISARYTPGMVGVYDVVFEVPSQATLSPTDNPATLTTGAQRPFAIGLQAPGSALTVVNSFIPIGN